LFYLFFPERYSVFDPAFRNRAGTETEAVLPFGFGLLLKNRIFMISCAP
jgi:hypothetical protein